MQFEIHKYTVQLQASAFPWGTFTKQQLEHVQRMLDARPLPPVATGASSRHAAYPCRHPCRRGQLARNRVPMA